MGDIGIAIFMIIGFIIIIGIYCAALFIPRKFDEDKYKEEIMNKTKKKETN